ncbi:fatty acid desaturase [Pseudonocardia alaniniphila]|uniref:Fatty acid desaturase n=1 Tax=Pseudonocardia alaniniphila TaxID=75291 RepID=A0ABS9TF55_9PSEU|nr:fatty acid desaturase [Pseudonocardia alaniniphila]MCH6167167.1 fatty acid desaturase [Pseudonocardia alaniniphila]
MDDVRASYLRFPGWTQHFWTWQTGRALPGQKPLIRHTWSTYLAMTLTVFLVGLTVSTLALTLMFPQWYLVLLVGWLLTVHGERLMVLVIAHQALHRRFSGSKRWDAFWGEVVTVLSVFHTFRDFKEEHFDNHHRREIFATEADPPFQSLQALGFRPGLSRAALWRRAWVVFLSPVFYWNGFAGRLVSNLKGGPVRLIAFTVWIGWWLSLPFWLPNGWLVLPLAFVVPVILFAQLSALLDRMGEHEWLAPRDPELGHRFYTAANTAARFCGSAVPARGDGPLAGLRWVAATLCYHVPSRLLVVVGDLPNHDYHHRYPSTPEWTTVAYARQRDIDTGPEGPPYREVWGMGAAIDLMFRSLSTREEDRGNAPSHR